MIRLPNNSSILRVPKISCIWCISPRYFFYYKCSFSYRRGQAVLKQFSRGFQPVSRTFVHDGFGQLWEPWALYIAPSPRKHLERVFQSNRILGLLALVEQRLGTGRRREGRLRLCRGWRVPHALGRSSGRPRHGRAAPVPGDVVQVGLPPTVRVAAARSQVAFAQGLDYVAHSCLCSWSMRPQPFGQRCNGCATASALVRRTAALLTLSRAQRDASPARRVVPRPSCGAGKGEAFIGPRAVEQLHGAIIGLAPPRGSEPKVGRQPLPFEQAARESQPAPHRQRPAAPHASTVPP